jgi:hypothetical protein
MTTMTKKIDWFKVGQQNRFDLRNSLNLPKLNISLEKSTILLLKGELKIILEASYLGESMFKIHTLTENGKSVLSNFLATNNEVKAESYIDLADYVTFESGLKDYKLDSFIDLKTEKIGENFVAPNIIGG